MVGMKYNRYLVVGITLLTVLFLFIFSGAVSETDAGLFGIDGFNTAEHGLGVLMLGIGLPLLLAAIYIAFRAKKDNSP
jgi:hypothetical protein